MAEHTEEQRWNGVYAGKKLGKPGYDLWLDSYEAQLSASKETPIIDLGCGYGSDTLYLTERGYRVIACDFSEEALKHIREFVPEAQTRKFDLSGGLPFEDGSAKLVVADLSLHYFRWDDTVNAIKEIARVVGRGGVLLARLNSVRDVHYGAGLGVQIEPHYYEHEGRLKRFFDDADIRRLFTEWTLECLQETEMLRYGKPKICWELAAIAP